MIWFAFAEPSLHGKTGMAVVHGLQLAAVAVVAQAVLVLGKRLTPDWQRLVIALVAGVIALYAATSVNTLLAIAFGAACGLFLLRGSSAPLLPPLDLHLSRHGGTIAGVAYFGLLIASLLIKQTGSGVLQVWSAFYQTGALVFGGGHVVLPLLEHAVVLPGWVTQPTFLAGYGFAQALPGPLFTFAAFLGTAIPSHSSRIAFGLVALIAISLPGLLAIGAALSFWSRMREIRHLQKILPGVNASVVGVLAAAFLRPVCSTAIHSVLDGVVAATAFAMLTFVKARPWMFWCRFWSCGDPRRGLHLIIYVHDCESSNLSDPLEGPTGFGLPEMPE
jgi:chromate transporter